MTIFNWKYTDNVTGKDASKRLKIENNIILMSLNSITRSLEFSIR